MRNVSTYLLISLALIAPPTAAYQDLSPLDRRLNVAVLDFSWNEKNEAAAKAALSAGANINQRSAGETLLTNAIKGQKVPAVIRFLLQNGIDRSGKDSSGLTALEIAQKYKIGKSPEGREILNLLGASASSPAPAPAKSTQTTPTAGASAAMPELVAAGVYECINQMGVATPLSFGIIDRSQYNDSNGKRGRYAYDAQTGTLTLDPGPSPARYRRISATTFRLVREDGSLGGFTCPLNTMKNPLRPPW